MRITQRDGSRPLKHTKEFYDWAKERVNVSFIKVKGHSGDKYNDMADALAKEALGLGGK